MWRIVVPFVSGLLFAIGLGLSQMTRPDVVLGFLDVANFEPALLLVMVGAIVVHALPTWWGLRRGRALLDGLHLPRATRVDARLVGGAVLFGLGWGLAGYCPGPAIVATAAGSSQAAVLVLGMLVGMGGVAGWERIRHAQAQSTPSGAEPMAR